MNSISKKKLGYIFVVVSVCLYSFSDAIMKYFMPYYGVNQIVFLRTMCRFIPLMCFAVYKKINPAQTNRVGENIFRSVLACFGTYAFMLAYKESNMVDVIVVGYTTAIFVIPLSVLLLQEKFYARDAIAVVVGFLGILLAFRPGLGIFRPGILLAVIGAVISALNQVIIKRLSFTDSEFTIIFYHHVTLLMTSLAFGFNDFSRLPFADAIYIIAGGVIGAIAQYCVIHAFKLSSSSHLASATYTMLIPATFWDFFIYHQTPDFFIIGGLVLISMGSFWVISARSQKQ
ncbi:MAG: DMT family transporter [Holosporaceae bacterium]|jgi:S-adenosylmethionine uptake transporter|nr:DMT family transporter [Holosporaceae bacterium]